MKEVSVFEGDSLLEDAPEFSVKNARVLLSGWDRNDQGVEVPLDDDILSKHMLFVGSIGMGKTNGIRQILSQLKEGLTNKDVMVIFDTKGDFYENFYKKGDIVISNDNNATGTTGVDYWNLFNEIEKDDSIEESILEISRSLFYEKVKRSTQPFFPNAARDIFSGLLLHFSRTGDKTKTNNEYLKKFLDESTVQEIRDILERHKDLRAIAGYISNEKSPQTQGILSELQQLIREILLGNFRKKGDLSIREAIRKKGAKVIFIEYDLALGATLTPIYSLLIDLALKEAMGRKKSEGNVWFVIDEFRLLPNLQHMDNGVNFGRSLGVKFIIGIQNIEQIYEAYGEYLAKSILSGFSTTVAFNVNDITTRTYIQELFGRNRKKEVFMSGVQTRGIVEQVRDANVVEDWNITGLERGEAILRIPDYQPFYFYFQEEK